MGGGQNLKQRNVDRLVFRNFEIANIQIKKDELSDHFIFKFCYYKILIFQMVKFKKFLNFPNCWIVKIREIFWLSDYNNFEKLANFSN